MKKSFLYVVMVALLLSSVGKIVGAWKWDMGGHADSEALDPLFTPVTGRQMLVIAAVAELITIGAVLRLGTTAKKASAILWLSLVFGTYRLGLKMVGFHGYCSCMGYWAKWANLSKAQVNTIALSILGFMFVGSALILVSEWMGRTARVDRVQAQPVSSA